LKILKINKLQMKNSFYLIIIFLIIIFFTTKANTLENKILFKINNEIVTSLDILNEIRYLKIINKELQNIEAGQLYEISKNALIKEKIKKIELLKNFKKIEVDEKLVNDVLLDGFKNFNISSKNQLFEFLKKQKIAPETIKDKIKIEILWNQLIFYKYSKSLKIDRELIKKDISNKKRQKEFLLSEIMFNLEKDEKLNRKFNLIKKTIIDKSFSQAATIYSISDTAKAGGKLGWIRFSSMNQRIKDQIIKIDTGNFTKPIVIPGGFLILKINQIRDANIEIDIKKEIEKTVNEIKNNQLKQYSNIYFNKVKKDILIYEY
jgi:peptidyl-prolyl cis-trans isomerase SurA